ncbi:MAG: glycerol-3-phosphate 1-O-acyltransferase PlsY [Oscillospiraceae bacterium]|nr:glycerol-3-phosphate 1-O-acyltransferase PlsY [Oscillospiraceae bacterium]
MRIKNKKDIREMGSGNPGLTNALRTGGKSTAVLVLLFDVLKGIISILAVRSFYLLLFPPPTIDTATWTLIDAMNFLTGNDEFGRYYFILHVFLWTASLFAVLGHCFPVYYKFKGGKAVLVTVATGLVINWQAALIALILFIIIVAITKYVSLGSVIAAALYPVCVFLTENLGVISGKNTNSLSFIGTIFTTTIAVILIWKHKENIKRLINKTEKKLGEKK